MTARVKGNERSWAIEIIALIKKFAAANGLAIKNAGGESSLASGGKTMFPDVVLYGDQEQSRSAILQGWELKMPDVPIEDETFISDAHRKAEALSLDSFLIWNFSYAVLYRRDEHGAFTIAQQWNETSHIRTREDVQRCRRDWEALLERILLELNRYFSTGQLQGAGVGDALANVALHSIIDYAKPLIAQELERQAFRNSTIEAELDEWWRGIHEEYERDEQGKYSAYAKTVALHWVCRVIFAHAIKFRRNEALLVDGIFHTTTPAAANSVFEKITQFCDFYNVFAPIQYNEIIPDAAWHSIVELSLFLKDSNFQELDQKTLQNVLEKTVSSAKRLVNGQFTTPPALADILVRLTVRDWSGEFLDCCCGTGTIPKAALRHKRRLMNAEQAAASVWACDKNAYPLQTAAISMAGADTINIANRLFQHNALGLQIGERITFVNPSTGKQENVPLPAFDAIASNLPFVEFERIPKDDKELTTHIEHAQTLSKRADLYSYIILKLADIMKPGARLGIITSNSWLGTKAGRQLFSAMLEKYEPLQFHISGNGRWFQNADVVATITVLQKKTASPFRGKASFFLWQSSLEELAADEEKTSHLVNSALLGRKITGCPAAISQYSLSQILQFTHRNISLNALFHNIEWLPEASDALLKISEVYDVFRGSRRGWDALFYPKVGEHRIEKRFLKKVLLSARNVERLTATAQDEAFCCSMDMKELRAASCDGALAWIQKFEHQHNRTGEPLPQVLHRANMHWYELHASEIADIFTAMNPDRRLFFSLLDAPSFINQRLIGLRHKPEYPDTELNHALLNSILTLFHVEASGFGRGLGVLDINKESIANCFMPNPQRISPEQRRKILHEFSAIKARSVMDMEKEMRDPARIRFEQAVLQSLGIGHLFEPARHSLLSMMHTRAAARPLS